MSRAWSARGRRPRQAFRQGRSALRRVFDLILAALILSLLGLLALRLDRVETRLAGAVTVNDGDTVTVRGERLRLRGIDAPEYHQTCKLDGQIYACGRRARDALKALVGDGPVNCSGWQRDRYGRLLVTCKAGSTELNRTLVEQGWAVAFGGFVAEEQAARQAGRGLWAGEFERPRHWRDTHGSLAEVDHDRFDGFFAWLMELFALANRPR